MVYVLHQPPRECAGLAGRRGVGAWHAHRHCDFGRRRRDVEIPPRTTKASFYKDAVPDKTYWAPAVVEHNGLFHMYLVYVPGIFDNWNHPRYIIHLTSKDLINWQYESTLPLADPKVIDAGVLHLPDGTWRLWYKDEATGSSCNYADSTDLYHWTDHGKVSGLS